MATALTIIISNGLGIIMSDAATSSVELPSIPADPQPILASEENVATWPATPGFRAFWDGVNGGATGYIAGTSCPSKKHPNMR